MKSNSSTVADPRGSPAGEDVGRRLLLARLFGGGERSAKFGRFALIKRVGEGAMGTVWSAYDEDLDRRVAVKVLVFERVLVRQYIHPLPTATVGDEEDVP